MRLVSPQLAVLLATVPPVNVFTHLVGSLGWREPRPLKIARRVVIYDKVLRIDLYARNACGSAARLVGVIVFTVSVLFGAHVPIRASTTTAIRDAKAVGAVFSGNVHRSSRQVEVLELREVNVRVGLCILIANLTILSTRFIEPLLLEVDIEERLVGVHGLLTVDNNLTAGCGY